MARSTQSMSRRCRQKHTVKPGTTPTAQIKTSMQQPFRFLDLPPELRVMVYGSLLEDDPNLTYDRAAPLPNDRIIVAPHGPGIRNIDMSSLTPPPIAQTCRLVRTEVMPVFGTGLRLCERAWDVDLPPAYLGYAPSRARRPEAFMHGRQWLRDLIDTKVIAPPTTFVIMFCARDVPQPSRPRHVYTYGRKYHLEFPEADLRFAPPADVSLRVLCSRFWHLEHPSDWMDSYKITDSDRRFHQGAQQRILHGTRSISKHLAKLRDIMERLRLKPIGDAGGRMGFREIDEVFQFYRSTVG